MELFEQVLSLREIVRRVGAGQMSGGPELGQLLANNGQALAASREENLALLRGAKTTVDLEEGLVRGFDEEEQSVAGTEASLMQFFTEIEEVSNGGEDALVIGEFKKAVWFLNERWKV
jgi:hypothetical protein